MFSDIAMKDRLPTSSDTTVMMTRLIMVNTWFGIERRFASVVLNPSCRKESWRY
jgi:hypothetical protein